VIILLAFACTALNIQSICVVLEHYSNGVLQIAFRAAEGGAACMHIQRVLEVLRLPARLSVEEVAILLGFHVDSVNFLVDEGLLEVLGEKDGVQRVFAASYIDGLRRDVKWLIKATNRVRQHHRERNAARKAGKAGAK
jgi:hypothetical protein